MAAKARARSLTREEANNDVRRRLIEIAAKHFAEHGFRGASQREMQREMGVNPATVSYHFGSKHDLYRAVVETYLHDIQEERLHRLEAIDPGVVGRKRLNRLLYDYFIPHVRVAVQPEGHAYARLLAHVQSESGSASEIFNDVVMPVRLKYLAALRKLYPSAPMRELSEVLMMGVALMAIVTNWRAGRGVPAEEAADRYATQLSRYAAAGFEAVFGPPVSGARARKKKAAPR